MAAKKVKNNKITTKYKKYLSEHGEQPVYRKLLMKRVDLCYQTEAKINNRKKIADGVFPWTPRRSIEKKKHIFENNQVKNV